MELQHPGQKYDSLCPPDRRHLPRTLQKSDHVLSHLRHLGTEHREERFLYRGIKLRQRSILPERRDDVGHETKDLARTLLQIIMGPVVDKRIPLPENIAYALEAGVHELSKWWWVIRPSVLAREVLIPFQQHFYPRQL